MRLGTNRAGALLLLAALLQMIPATAVSRAEQAIVPSLISPSQGWGIFAGTRGDLEVTVDRPGIAVRIEVPREFLNGRRENDTSFLSSDISSDYYYYSVIDQSLHYSRYRDAPGYKPNFPPYDPNAPYTVEVWSHNGTGFVRFSPPRHVWMKGISAPPVAGRYEFLVYVAEGTCENSCLPLFPVDPTRRLTITVSLGPQPCSIKGFIIDPLTDPPRAITAKGVVYAFDKERNLVARSFVDNNTGFFEICGLREGEYRLEASAGYWNNTGYAYVLTRHPDAIRVFRDGNTTVRILLNRGCTITGEIRYADPLGNPIASLSHPSFDGLTHPWSNSRYRVGSLNYTVEAVTESGETVASFSAQSSGSSSDPFVLKDRGEICYVGYPPTATAYSGILPGKYLIRAWAFGYVQKNLLPVTATPYSTVKVQVTLTTGGAIVGTINFRDPRTLRPETPRKAEQLGFGTSTGCLYGGNILISAYDSQGKLAAVTTIEGTLLNGTTAYADLSTIRFHLIGFSESLNRTYSGVWKRRDCGIASGGYSVRIHVRGYRQMENGEVTIYEGSNSTVHITLLRQAGVSAVVVSTTLSDGYSTEVPWAFKDLTPQPYLRFYVYHREGSEAGYVETRIGPRTPATCTSPLNFTGRVCTISDIIFHGCVPNSLTEGSYELKAFTFGYIQRSSHRLIVSEGYVVQTGLRIYQGLNASGTVWVKAGGFLASMTENAEARIEAYDSYGALAAATSSYPKSGQGSFNFTLAGLRGVGHFFHVTPSGDRVKDYGIQSGKYRVKIHDFGAEWRYRLPYQPIIRIEAPGSTMYLVANRMNKVFGRICGVTTDNLAVPLSWVAVNAWNEPVYSIDGRFTLHLEEGTYQISFSLRGYLQKSVEVILTGSRAVPLDMILEPE